MKNSLLILVIPFFTFMGQVKSQSVVGFWEVTSVKVGERTMTPVAKWFRNNDDGTFQSGNGWTQNSYGKWSFDKIAMEFTPVNENGIKDEFGPFKVTFSNNSMSWTRKEEGMTVIVSLIPIAEMPMAPEDRIQGLWQLSSVLKGEEDIKSIVDPNAKQFIHVRPDRRFRLRNPDKTVDQGFWHMDGHRPEFTLINYDRSKENQVFSIDFDKNMLIMKQQNDDTIVFIYQRIDVFPE